MFLISKNIIVRRYHSLNFSLNYIFTLLFYRNYGLQELERCIILRSDTQTGMILNIIEYFVKFNKIINKTIFYF